MANVLLKQNVTTNSKELPFIPDGKCEYLCCALTQIYKHALNELDPVTLSFGYFSLGLASPRLP